MARRRRLPGLGDGTPLRVRLVALLLLLLALGLLVAGTISTLALRNSLLNRVDDQLRQAASGIASNRSNVGQDGFRGGDGDPRGAAGPSRFYVALLPSDGSVVTLMSAQPSDAPPGPKLTGTTLDQTVRRNFAPYTVDSVSGGGRWRVVLLTALQNGVPVGSVAVAADLSDVDRPVRNLAVLEVVVGSATLAALAGVGYLVVKRSLRGLVQVEEAAAAVAGGDLSRRVPERDPRTELGSLGLSFNEMVEQVQTAFATRAASQERLRRFVADASHELRTPLTSVRGFAELYRQGAVSEPEDVGRLMGRIESESKRMGQLVEDMLTLARLDEHRPLDMRPVDLGVLAADAVHDARAVRPERVVTLELPEQPLVVQGDESRLRQILANLVGNALTHAPAPAQTAVRVFRSSGSPDAVIEVRDDGPGMSPDVAERIFERFYRADASRTRASGGAGLGLSIAASLAAAHGGRIELATAPGRGASFRVLLPA